MAQEFSVINNLSSLAAQKNMYFSHLDLQKTLSRLSSGLRIVDASDDAAGLAMANALKADVAALSQAVRNAGDGVGIVQIADGALSQINGLLGRAVTLASQAASGTVGTEERRTLNIEYQQILSEVDRVISVTNFKGEPLFAQSGAVTKGIYVGDTQLSSTITISIAGAQGSGTQALGLRGTDITTSAGARQVLPHLQQAMASVSHWRGALGAQQNRLINAVANIQIQHQNVLAAESAISDANMAQEMVNMVKGQILLRSGMASLAQANASSQLVLSLFR